jgi:broad specificity phosphatase PhoE
VTTFAASVRRLYLMRHGETLYLGGRSEDGLDLTPEGRRQIEVAAELFSSVPLDLVLSSPMRRALGTARIVAERQGVQVEVAEGLREITPGPLDDMELTKVFSDVIAFFSSGSINWDTPFLGGETFRQLCDRVLRFVNELLARPGWTNALAVAHGGANMALLAGLLGLQETQIPRLEQDLGCINAIDFSPENRVLIRLCNFSAHDALKAAQRDPSFERLRRVLSERAEQLAGVPWRVLGGDVEV